MLTSKIGDDDYATYKDVAVQYKIACRGLRGNEPKKEKAVVRVPSGSYVYTHVTLNASAEHVEPLLDWLLFPFFPSVETLGDSEFADVRKYCLRENDEDFNADDEDCIISRDKKKQETPEALPVSQSVPPLVSQPVPPLVSLFPQINPIIPIKVRKVEVKKKEVKKEGVRKVGSDGYKVRMDRHIKPKIGFDDRFKFITLMLTSIKSTEQTSVVSVMFFNYVLDYKACSGEIKASPHMRLAALTLATCLGTVYGIPNILNMFDSVNRDHLNSALDDLGTQDLSAHHQYADVLRGMGREPVVRKNTLRLDSHNLWHPKTLI